ncbi:hypothetical protein BH10ACT9_BH10ACT9_04290 [soil metagenome]
MTTGAFALTVAMGVAGAASASADPEQAQFGAQHRVTSDEGAAISGYTVTDLRPSDLPTLEVPLVGTVPLDGDLWQATVTVDAVRGSVVPAMRMFNAQSADGQSYRVLDQALVPDLDVSPMPEGRRSTGNLYFDVIGSAPSLVTFDDGVDQLVWTS